MRNFNTSGFGIGASSDSCTDTFKGPYRNSEPETRVAYQEILDNARNIRVSLSLHSIGKASIDVIKTIAILNLDSAFLIYSHLLFKFLQVNHGLRRLAIGTSHPLTMKSF